MILKHIRNSVIAKKLNANCNRFPANIYLFKVNNRNIRKMCEICPKLTIETPERRR